MKILAVSDVIDRGIYNVDVLRRRAGDAALIISCGDLPNTYLDFIASILVRPLYYVRGNHYWEDTRQGQTPVVPSGNLDNRVVNERGLLLAGLEGSMRYKPGAAQYTDAEMWGKVIGMMPKLVMNRWRRGRAVDILVTHAPPFGIHDRPDRPHRGFKAFLKFMQWFKPQYLLHGHVHIWDNRTPTRTCYEQTWVVNVYPWRIIEIDHDFSTHRRRSIL
ncbi:MAG: metallophosphoesterase [Anaerolineae bacterium]|nr:metallophosphoesterase [Anaerolineae bacterium]